MNTPEGITTCSKGSQDLDEDFSLVPPPEENTPDCEGCGKPIHGQKFGRFRRRQMEMPRLPGKRGIEVMNEELKQELVEAFRNAGVDAYIDKDGEVMVPDRMGDEHSLLCDNAHYDAVATFLMLDAIEQAGYSTELGKDSGSNQFHFVVEKANKEWGCAGATRSEAVARAFIQCFKEKKDV